MPIPGKPKVYTVLIPAGVVTATRLRLGGQGEAGETGSPSGDLYVEITTE